jgi:hypothetical protein
MSWENGVKTYDISDELAKLKSKISENTIMAYEVDGHGYYWEMYTPSNDIDGDYLTTVNTLDQVMKIARDTSSRLTIHTQEWYLTYGGGQEL